MKNWHLESCSKMGEKFGYSGAVVIRHLRKRGVIISKELSYKLRGKSLKGRSKSTPELDAKIKELYLDLPLKALARELNTGVTFLINRMKYLNLVIPKELIEQRKKASQLQPGNIPFNKGLKVEDFMSEEGVKKFKKNTFRKGNIPHNAYNQPGKITIRGKRNKSERYKYICLELGKWVLLHQHVWEQEHGAIPKRHTIRFIDGNSLNCELSNLQCVSMADNLSLNQLGDNAIATRLSSLGANGIDRDFREEILKNHPGLIEIKRQQLLLQRQIKNEKNILDTRENKKA